MNIETAIQAAIDSGAQYGIGSLNEPTHKRLPEILSSKKPA